MKGLLGCRNMDVAAPCRGPHTFTRSGWRGADILVWPAVQHYLPGVVAAWDREAYNKPPGFDSSHSGPALGGSLDVAAHSVGGRLQGKWKRVSLGG